MPHFECGAFNHSATSPETTAKIAVSAGYVSSTIKQNKGAPAWL
jgi:hypothetical protein